MNYKTYSRNQMLKIIKKGFLFVETNYGDTYIIKKTDLADFIILEAMNTGEALELTVYMPGIDTPVITTYGWFLNKANSVLRKEIIKRLVLLQTTNTRPKDVKVFDNEMFCRLDAKHMGIINGKIKNFDKLYKKYQIAQKPI